MSACGLQLTFGQSPQTELGDSFIAVDHLLLTIYGIAELAPILGNAGLSKVWLQPTGLMRCCGIAGDVVAQ
jgi:hypothetical protein